MQWIEWIRNVMSLVKDRWADDKRCEQLLDFYTWLEKWLAYIKKSHICNKQYICNRENKTSETLEIWVNNWEG